MQGSSPLDRVPIRGLNRQQSALVRVLEGAGGAVLPVPEIIRRIYGDPQARCYEIVKVMVHHIRKERPDIGSRIVSGYGQGYGMPPRREAS